MTSKRSEQRVPQLLKSIAKDLGDEMTMEELRKRTLYQVAARKTKALWLPTEDGAGKLNDKATNEYWIHLRDNGMPQVVRDGVTPVTFDVLSGVDKQEYYHILFDGETIVRGQDTYGNDWDKVAPEMMDAIYWARTTNDKLFPRAIDAFDTYEEIANESHRRWAMIFAAYKASGETVDRRVASVTQHSDPSAPSSRIDYTRTTTEVTHLAVSGNSLSGAEFKIVTEAVLSAFPEYNSLERALFFGIDVRLESIVSSGNHMSKVGFELVSWATRTGRLIEVLTALKSNNSGNPHLQAIQIAGNNINTNGGTFVGGNMNIGGDVINGDKVNGDTIIVGNISAGSRGIAIGKNASTTIVTGDGNNIISRS